jgi:DNA-binding NarL/FixJ family response regulator
MTEPRAWRPPRAPAEAARLCSDEARRGRLAPVAVEAVLAAARHRATTRNYGEPRAGLTTREIDVLTRLARGRTRREIATELAQATRDDVARVVDKTGAASRAAAATFIVLHDLV